jgi:serine/threonine protein kinase
MSSNNKFFGTVPFLDPQKLNNGKKFTLGKRSDIYSLGMVLWEISSCRTPFCEEDLAYLSLKICQGLKEKSVKGTPMDYIRIYTNCWQFEPDSRPSINQILTRLQSISLEPVFEGDDGFISSHSPDSPHTSRNFTSGIILLI